MQLRHGRYECPRFAAPNLVLKVAVLVMSAKHPNTSASLSNELHSPERAVVGLISQFSAFMLFCSGNIHKSYGIGVSHDIQAFSYFDHPPLSFWITNFFIPLLGDGRTALPHLMVIFPPTTPGRFFC